MRGVRPMSRHEAHDVHQAARRMVRGLVRRAAEGDTFALEALVELEAEVPTAVNLAVSLMQSGERMTGNRSDGYSFTELGAVMGTSRQAARQRAARVVLAPPTPSTVYYSLPAAQ